MESTWIKQQEMIRNIPGIEDVLAAHDEWDTYFREMRVFLKNDSIGSPPRMPLTDIDMLRGKYPQASAFVDALEFSEEPNEAKAVAGDRAMTRIAAGEDPDLVISEMVQEWKRACGLSDA